MPASGAVEVQRELAAGAASHQAPVNPCMPETAWPEAGPSPGGDCCDRRKCPALCHSGPAGYKELVFSPLAVTGRDHQ